MQLKWIKVGLGGLIALIFALVNVSAMQSVQASTLKDGTYSNAVTVHVYKNSNGSISSEDSDAADFFNTTASAEVSNGKVQVTMSLIHSGEKFITSATVDGQPVSISGTNFTFSLSEPKTQVSTTFDLMIPGIGKQTPSAWITLDWSKIPTVTESSANSESSSQGSSVVTIPMQDAHSAATTSTSSSTSTVTATSDTSAKNKDTRSTSTTPTTKAATTKAKTTGSALTTTGWTYEVLQADNNQVSAANKFYTHAAKVTKVGSHYQVQLMVKYAKNSGMQARGFKPITTDGEAAQNVVYGTSGKDYAVTYTFNVNKLSDLNQLIKGTVHVAVPTVGINQDFTVRFKFSHQGTAINHAADSARAVPTSNKMTRNGSTNGDAADTATGNHHGNLPQTSERRTVLASVLGLVTLLAVSGVVLYRKSRVIK